ncbi:MULTISPECIES: penicillin-binding protein 1C [unclassified Okeania]|uniref:penicillin-binding protein 1C n=1 Tax=unclassified Okeania TaxID=2634635 RepID=UPI0013BB8852|nr:MULTISPECIES: penicillin-binding protein 1C [unclassified Okeania]NES78535.1 penicillin-binding protein 1C [Okeania sp. SIO1H4]NET12397.1 penicillin-binding protein 1C [Okeania sp. SIO1H6]NET21906.1 penicillin-binding protein 1C [Okeania sp. SIO1H5]NET95111.1 penicillin-binding protein 1C [Okeania sp. SIO1H2]
MIKITKHISKNIKQKWHQTKPRSKFILGFVLLCLSVRALPLFAPIRPQDITQNQQTLEFIDRNGLPLGTILTRDQENTVVVSLEQISPLFINAIIAAEDKRYYQHGALDIKAIGRSLLEAIQAKQIVSGASTITMQLARMLDPTPRTLGNKVREIWLSWRITAGMNKNQILQAYINRLPMGGNIYGVEAASRAYFGISATDLNLAQATILAALPNDPTDLNPYYNWSLLKQRQIYILKRMVEDNYITSAEAEKVLAEKITLQPKNQGIIAAPHFLFWLSQNQSTAINQNLSTTTTPTVIRTTIDRPLQQFVTTQVQQVIQNLTPYNVHHAAAIVINNQTGEVLAYVGSPDYFNTQKMGSNDGVQALRQPGSTLKPFLYQLALENQVINPNTILPDVPTYYAIPGAKLYSPTNYNQDRFLGPVIVRVALANSLNIPAVRVLEKVGVKQFLNRLHQLGFTHLQASPEHYGLGLSLGSGEVSLWELAKAYSIMARQGEVIPVVTTIPSKTYPLFQHKKNQDISLLPQAESKWMLIANMLSDTHARAAEFGVNSALNLPFPAAVKTGTSSDFRDTWTVGFTNDYTVAVWVGNFSGESMVQISGVMGAAPLWNRIMLHLHEKKEATAFPPPKNMVQRPVCTISGLRPKSDCPSVITEYFYPEKLREYEHLSALYSVENLPDEYNEWLAKQSKSSLVSDELKILFPQEDDYFLMDDVGGEKKLEFKLANSRENSVEWWLNGEKLAVNFDNSLFWKLSPGKWTLEVRSADIIDRVNFEVKLPNKSPYNGFSIRIRSQESGVRSQESGGKK